MKRKGLHLLAVAVTASVLTAAAPTAGKRVKLFNGKNLDGWTLLKCEAQVDNGHIVLLSGNGLVQTKKKYADFVLEWDWKMLAEDKWDSGVYFRYDKVLPKRPWPARYQANLRKGMEGNVDGIKGATSKGMIKPHKWNKFKLTVKGDKVDLRINGKQAWKGEGLAGPKSGYIALQAEVPHGGQHRFRNIYITELKAKAPKAKKPAPKKLKPAE